MMAVLVPEMLRVWYWLTLDSRSLSPDNRTMNPNTPCMQPTAAKKNNRMKDISRMVRDVDQPVRHNKSANSRETSPVSSNADEKKRNTRRPRFSGSDDLTCKGTVRPGIGAAAVSGTAFAMSALVMREIE